MPGSVRAVTDGSQGGCSHGWAAVPAAVRSSARTCKMSGNSIGLRRMLKLPSCSSLATPVGHARAAAIPLPFGMWTRDTWRCTSKTKIVAVRAHTLVRDQSEHNHCGCTCSGHTHIHARPCVMNVKN